MSVSRHRLPQKRCFITQAFARRFGQVRLSHAGTGRIAQRTRALCYVGLHNSNGANRSMPSASSAGKAVGGVAAPVLPLVGDRPVERGSQQNLLRRHRHANERCSRDSCNRVFRVNNANGDSPVQVVELSTVGGARRRIGCNERVLFGLTPLDVGQWPVARSTISNPAHRRFPFL